VLGPAKGDYTPQAYVLEMMADSIGFMFDVRAGVGLSRVDHSMHIQDQTYRAGGRTVSRQLCVGTLLVACSVLLAGCKKRVSDCPWEDIPIVPISEYSFEMKDLHRLDVLAGCKNEWSAAHGNPCASDVPIPFAKKGVQYGEQDLKWVRQSLANQVSVCFDNTTGANSGGNCSSWTTHEWGCDKDEFGICNCTHRSGTLCDRWRCISKEVHHRTCWEANWESTPKSECDLAGNHPWGLNLTRFTEILDAERTSDAIHMHDYAAEQKLASAQKFYNVPQLPSPGCALQQPADGKDFPKAANCREWRVVRTKLLQCHCESWDQTDMYCTSWTCQDAASFKNKRTRHPERRTFKCHRTYDLNVSGCAQHGVENILTAILPASLSAEAVLYRTATKRSAQFTGCRVS